MPPAPVRRALSLSSGATERSGAGTPPGTPGTPQARREPVEPAVARGSAASRARSVAAMVLKGQLSFQLPPVVKIMVGPGALDCQVKVTVQGAKAEGNGLPDVVAAGKTVSAVWASTSVCRGAATKGTLRVEGFEPLAFSVAHSDQGSTYVHSKGKWRHTMLTAPEWDWRGHGDRPAEGRACDLEILSASYADKVPVIRVQVRAATEVELKRFLQLRAMQEAQDGDDYDTLHAQVQKAKLAGVERADIERGEERLKELRKLGLHVAEGADKESLRGLMAWAAVTRTPYSGENFPCSASTCCPCNEQHRPGEVLEIVSNSVQDCLSEFGPEGDRELFDELASAALAVEEGAVWRAGGKFIFSAFDRNQSVSALTRMLNNHGRSRCARMLLQMVKYSEARYTGYVTSIQVNFHPHGNTYHAQHRDIYSAKQRAGPNCTCSFRKCIGTVCYTVGSSRVCVLETCTDELSAVKACGEDCGGRKEIRWLHSGDAMFFNEAWNNNHTHGIPSMEEMQPGVPCGPRISVAFLLGAEEENICVLR